MLIAFAGLPSAGKSSTAVALGELLGATAFLEPEEKDWPQLVHDRERIGRFTALTWFRGVRVPSLFEAESIHLAGGVAIVDSYYDKLISKYLQQECFSWLLPKTDPYFKVALDMAIADYKNLPNASILVFLKIQEQTWKRFMRNRGRVFDQAAELSSQFEMQKHIENAARLAALEFGMRFCIIEQEWSSPEATARLVQDFL